MLTPLASINEVTETTMDDLALVCANCHRIIHSKFPPFEINEVSEMIRMQRTENIEG